jgi:hypothetical protein
MSMGRVGVRLVCRHARQRTALRGGGNVNEARAGRVRAHGLEHAKRDSGVRVEVGEWFAHRTPVRDACGAVHHERCVGDCGVGAILFAQVSLDQAGR